MTCEYLAHADNMLTSFSLIFTSSNVVGGWVAPIFQLGIFAVPPTTHRKIPSLGVVIFSLELKLDRVQP